MALLGGKVNSRFAVLAAVLPVAGLALVVSAAACGSRENGRLEAPPSLSLGEAYDSLTEPQFNLYWLGGDIRVGGHRMEGPYVCGIGCELTADTLESHYLADAESEVPSLRWTISTPKGWAEDQLAIGAPRTGSVEETRAEVAGRPALVLTYRGTQGEVLFLRAVITADEKTLVIVTAESQLLADAGTLVDLLQGLQPYPEN
jgi:hypothetical protein